MAHKHSVYDTEPHFQIDKTSREIKNVSNSKTTITQFDHNSERFTFEIPRFIDSHDMSLCNKVQVHYINIDSTDKNNQNIGVYTVDDLQLSPDDENIVICSWLISQNATQLAGSLVFLLRFACVTDDVLDYAWNTSRCTTISVSNGLYNGEAIIEEYFDILATWEQNIIADVTVGIDEAIETKIDNIKLVETATGNAITIDSSEAPIPYMKLSGKTTQNGTPTPDAPVPLVSVGDSGSFEVGVYGKNFGEFEYSSGSADWWSLLIAKKVRIPKGSNVTISVDVEVASATKVFWNSSSGTLPNTKVETLTAGKSRISYSFITQTEINKNSDIWLSKSGTGDGVLVTCSNAQLEFGSVATPYEPCNKQILTMPYTLRSVGDIKDEVDFNRGVLIRKVGSVDLGTSTWLFMTGNRFTSEAVVNLKKPSSKGEKVNALCSHYAVDTFNNAYAQSTDHILAVPSDVTNISIVDKSYTDATALKTALSGVMCYYELETPIETPLTESELNAYRQLMTNKGTTTILSESDVEMLYYVNKPNAQAIGDIHTQINKDYFKTLSLIAENVATVEETESESEE